MLPSLMESPSGGTTTDVLNAAPQAGPPPVSRARRAASRATSMVGGGRGRSGLARGKGCREGARETRGRGEGAGGATEKARGAVKLYSPPPRAEAA
jgi:hypothetical protein